MVGEAGVARERFQLVDARRERLDAGHEGARVADHLDASRAIARHDELDVPGAQPERAADEGSFGAQADVGRRHGDGELRLQPCGLELGSTARDVARERPERIGVERRRDLEARPQAVGDLGGEGALLPVLGEQHEARAPVEAAWRSHVTGSARAWAPSRRSTDAPPRRGGGRLARGGATRARRARAPSRAARGPRRCAPAAPRRRP